MYINDVEINDIIPIFIIKLSIKQKFNIKNIKS